MPPLIFTENSWHLPGILKICRTSVTQEFELETFFTDQFDNFQIFRAFPKFSEYLKENFHERFFRCTFFVFV